MAESRNTINDIPTFIIDTLMPPEKQLMQVSNFDPKMKTLVLTELGEDCQNRGLQPIGSESDCIASTEFIKAHYPSYEFHNVETFASYPKGCYVYVASSKKSFGYFNMHSSGSGHGRSRTICKNVGE